MTRAKAAALDAEPVKAVLQTKKAAVNANTAGQRKRNALGDVTNAGKAEVVEGKKPLAAKTGGLVSKAAQPTGIQKNHGRTTSTARSIVASKEAKKTELKRNGSGIGVSVAASQKRKVASTIVKQDVLAGEEPARKKANTVNSENSLRPASKLDGLSADLEKIDDAIEEHEANKVAGRPKDVPNLDAEDMDDPLMAAEYATEIFEYLRDLECKSIPNPQYMNHQDDLSWKTRGILIDWLIEVHTRFHLLPETLFLAINVIDRFLSEKVIQLDRLQLVGITAMFIASKYEEVLSPHVANFVHVADDGFMESEILSAERFILGTLDYDLSYPNPMNFLRRISKADNYDMQTRTIGKYLMEISLLDHRFMSFRPSHIAAAAMYLSRMILDRGEWVSSFPAP
jgi:G2/mitotic-specific cyclin 2